MVEAGDWGGVGDGVLSGKEEVGSADVSDVEEAPPLALGMSPNRLSRIIYATFHARVKAAVFDEKEGLDPVATDFLHQVGVPINHADFCAINQYCRLCCVSKRVSVRGR